MLFFEGEVTLFVPLFSPYFRWLQKGNPAGAVERYPQIDKDNQSSAKGVYIVGDLTGIPLLKLAAEGGARMVRRFAADKEFTSKAKGVANRSQGEGRVRDLVIIGGGPAGIACALECEKQGWDYQILESSQLFNTIENFPKGKPIFAKPDVYPTDGPLEIKNGYKETLLADLHQQLDGKPLQLKLGMRVEGISRKKDVLTLKTNQGELKAQRVVVAMGKAGDARRLGVPGEELPHVFNKLYDPGEFYEEDILVVGGGDSAVEAAIALAEAGNRVTLSYRKEALDRPKQENVERFEELKQAGRITPVFNSQPKLIRAGETVLTVDGKEQAVKSQQVFSLIGRELPLAFFKRSGIKMEGEKDRSYFLFFFAMISFFSMLYFGKAGVARDLFKDAHGFKDLLLAYLTKPLSLRLNWAIDHYSWYSSLNFYLGWLGSLAFLITGAAAVCLMIKRREKYFGSAWSTIKYGYFILVALAYTWVYFHFLLGRTAGWVEEPTYYYSLFYSLTILLFGIRRTMVKKTRYIRYQMLSLAFFQVFFLFLLPFHLFDPLIKAHFSADSYVMREMFPSGKWSCFGFVLFWPLDMNDFGASTFWTWFPFVQTFGILFLIVKKWGKGAYCGWICSCGGMAETLGDEYRVQAPHGKKPKALENIGQVILLWAVLVTAASYASHHLGAGTHLGLGTGFADTFRGLYKLGIDVFFAGVLGLGVYFFLSGRVWCRFGCPLAALMHAYSRFSTYRIFSEKKKCISCNICTKVCHMGIDVMNYANKGIPMNDVECVRCSACVQSCPTEVLSFGQLLKGDTENRERLELPPDYSKDDWRAGVH